MTQVTIPLELLLSGIAGLLMLGIGGTWRIVSVVRAERAALKSELKTEINELWAALKAAEEKWDRKADVVHKRIGEHGKSAGETATELARLPGSLESTGANRPPHIRCLI